MTGSPFDTDSEALAWMRDRVGKHLDHLDQMAAHAVATGTNNERWQGMANASRFLRRALANAAGSVIAEAAEDAADRAEAAAARVQALASHGEESW